MRDTLTIIRVGENVNFCGEAKSEHPLPRWWRTFERNEVSEFLREPVIMVSAQGTTSNGREDHGVSAFILT